MNTRLAITILSICLYAAPAVGQATQARHSRTGGWNSIPPTPEQTAALEQVGRLEKAAAVALDAGAYAQAEADARQAQDTGLDPGVAAEILAGALEAQGKDQEALQVYKTIADEGGVLPRNLLPYSLLLLKSGQWAQAAAAYDKALPLLVGGDLVRARGAFSPDTPEPMALATAIHIAHGLTLNSGFDWAGKIQNDRALVEYQKALTLSPDSDLANLYYGYGLKRLGRKAEAKAAFAKAAQLGGDDVRAEVKRFSP